MSAAACRAPCIRLLWAILIVVAISQPLGPARGTENEPVRDDAVSREDVPTGAGQVPADELPTGDEIPPDAVPPAAEDLPPDDDLPPEDAPRTGIIDAGHARASAGVRGLGAWIDGFFANPEYEAELNESRLRVRADGFAESGEGLDGDAKARLFLKLPALDDRIRVEVLSAGEAEEDTAAEGAATPASSDLSLDSITAALSYFFRNDEERSVSARVGLDFDGYDPNPFVGMRYRAQVELSEKWNFRFVQRVRYYSLDGLESRSIFQFDRGLPRDMLFRWETAGTWLEEQPNYFYGVNFAVFQPLDEKSAVEYQVLNSFQTDPHRLDEVTLRFRYRRQLWREWLIVEAAPQLRLPRVDRYDPIPGILLRLELTFGG